jgi:hypothetical protein
MSDDTVYAVATAYVEVPADYPVHHMDSIRTELFDTIHGRLEPTDVEVRHTSFGTVPIDEVPKVDPDA